MEMERKKLKGQSNSNKHYEASGLKRTQKTILLILMQQYSSTKLLARKGTLPPPPPQ